MTYGNDGKMGDGNGEEKCPHCGEVHNMRVIEKAGEELTNEIFPEVWKEVKQEMKELSKKEVAEQMFFLGTVQAMYATQESVRHLADEKGELARKEEEYFAMPDEKKYEYLLNCEEEPECEFSNFGMELEKKGEYEKAKKLYKREAELYPEDFSGYEKLGRLYAKMKKFDLAEHNLKNALDLALQQKEENPDCIDDKVIDEIRKNLEEVKNAKH